VREDKGVHRFAAAFLIAVAAFCAQQARENRLTREKSPYLLQHAHNPVDWYPWGEEAFARARKEGKPIFLSVGYSTCHWCHVMERESFANGEIAAQLNRDFVAIKVDREERPDVDRLFMAYVVGTTGHGGWPMSVWLTAEGKPFHGGTYFAPERFKATLSRIAEAWKTERESIERSSEEMVRRLRDLNTASRGEELIDRSAVAAAVSHYSGAFDARHGGFGKAPKFPRPVALAFLLRHGGDAGRPMVEKTLEAMARSGLQDQLAGGFHRYATDEAWNVPHFEKMLYDQAQLAVVYLEAFQITKRAEFAQTARRTLDYVLSEMRSPEGGFYTAEDADSEGEEGAFYLWTREELEKTLGKPAAEWMAYRYGVEGTGKVTLRQARTADETARRFEIPVKQVDQATRRLQAARARRPRPLRDDKVLAAWNGLMISAMAKAAAVLEEERYAQAARRAADFVLSRMYREGVLFRRYRGGEAAIEGFLDDYAFLAQGLIDLYETVFDLRYLEAAEELTRQQMSRFRNPDTGAFYTTTGKDGKLWMRMEDGYDGAEPSGNSVAAMNLLRLAEFGDRKDWREAADQMMRAFSGRVQADAEAYPGILTANGYRAAAGKQIVLVGERGEAMSRMLRAVHEKFLPHRIVLMVSSQDERRKLAARIEVVESMTSINGKPMAYVCENYSCKLPVNEPARLAELLQ
jgi:uncharacterized protein YyaL (SSP411 family)